MKLGSIGRRWWWERHGCQCFLPFWIVELIIARWMGRGGVPDKSFAFGADAHGELMRLGQKQIFLNQWLGEVVALVELEIDWTSLSF
jgi:hypothetical protein